MCEQVWQAHQLSKTVEQITTVDNVKHTLFKCCPFLRRIFAKTLSVSLIPGHLRLLQLVTM